MSPHTKRTSRSQRSDTFPWSMESWFSEVAQHRSTAALSVLPEVPRTSSELVDLVLPPCPVSPRPTIRPRTRRAPPDPRENRPKSNATHPEAGVREATSEPVGPGFFRDGKPRAHDDGRTVGPGVVPR